MFSLNCHVCRMVDNVSSCYSLYELTLHLRGCNVGCGPFDPYNGYV